MKVGLHLALGGVVCAALVGCDSGRDLPLVPVSGRVTIDGGRPPKEGTVGFSPIPGSGLPGMPHRPAMAKFDTSGSFAATSFENGDGLLPGRYIVRIRCMEREPKPGESGEKLSYVPLDYEPDELVVEEGSRPIVVNYDVPRNEKVAP